MSRGKQTGGYAGEDKMKKRCKNCQYWESEDRVTGRCEKDDSVRDKDYYCDFYQLHEDVHTPGSAF